VTKVEGSNLGHMKPTTYIRPIPTPIPKYIEPISWIDLGGIDILLL